MDGKSLAPWGQRPNEGNAIKRPEEKYCHECGAIIRAKAEICPRCGVRQPTVSTGAFVSGHQRNRVMAALFGILLGGLGIHQFYLGRIGLGILYVVFCWTLVPAIVGFIEGIIYLSMSDAAFSAKYDGVPSH